MREQILLIESQGSQGIACLGLATEVNKLSFKEKTKIIELVSSTVSTKLPKAVTIQSKNLNEYKMYVKKYRKVYKST